jgi:hypothetical protein
MNSGAQAQNKPLLNDQVSSIPTLGSGANINTLSNNDSYIPTMGGPGKRPNRFGAP